MPPFTQVPDHPKSTLLVYPNCTRASSQSALPVISVPQLQRSEAEPARKYGADSALHAVHVLCVPSVCCVQALQPVTPVAQPVQRL